MQNTYVEQFIVNFQKILGVGKNNELRKTLSPQECKAKVIRDGESITIIPTANNYFMPAITINDANLFEKLMERYLDAIKRTNIKSTKMDKTHNEQYFIFNVWKNATAYDFQNPEKFISRYTNFILDNTFEQYDTLTELGDYEGNRLMVKREQDGYGFETPYKMHFSLTNGNASCNLPCIRYGISKNKLGEKVAYIYALQNMEPSIDSKYNDTVKKLLNRANSGVKKYRNVTPSAIAVLTVFLGMLEKESITALKVPDLLIGRYGRFLNVHTQEEMDRIQDNLTNKFLRNFIRLSEQLKNMKIETGIGNGIDSFLYISLEPMKECDNELLNSLYNLGSGKNNRDMEMEL